jgi:hypothetical protein
MGVDLCFGREKNFAEWERTFLSSPRIVSTPRREKGNRGPVTSLLRKNEYFEG